jgi:hypothetical protein
MIRAAVFSDVPGLVSIGALFHSQTVLADLLLYDGESVRQLLTASIESDSCAVFVLEEKGEVIGGICGSVVPMYFNHRLLVGQQFAWFVRPTRRRGLAALGLLDAFERWAVEDKGAVAVFSGAKNDANAEGMEKLLGRRGYLNLESMYLKTVGG